MVAGVIMAVGISTGVAAEDMAAGKDIAETWERRPRAGRRFLISFLVVESVNLARAAAGMDDVVPECQAGSKSHVCF
jgi:hypothetical protein